MIILFYYVTTILCKIKIRGCDSTIDQKQSRRILIKARAGNLVSFYSYRATYSSGVNS